MIPTAVEPDVARAAIARCWLEGNAAPPPESEGKTDLPSLGAITLLPHQVEAMRLLRASLAESGGAVLADEVGMGKTFVALALAHEAARPVVVAPAGLRPMWHQAGVRVGIDVRQISTESLSRTGYPGVAGGAGSSDLVIVDEAHHFRNPATRRYRALARLTAGARVLLLTATPIHNWTGDLAALLGLFLGAGAWTMSNDDRARFVVRRGHTDIRQIKTSSEGAAVPDRMALGVPTIDGPHPLPIADDEATLRALVALPPPVPPADGGDGGALVTIALARQWASSGGALRGALRRRLERAAALSAGMESGAYPSYRDLREWCVGEGAVQLSFPEMLVPADPASAKLLPAVRVHAEAIRELLGTLAAKPDPDEARAERLRSVVRSHEAVVAFSSYEDTVRALYRRLRSTVRVCALSAQGAVVAGGKISRWEAMAQFSPGYRTSRGGAPPSDRIDLLLTTDILSEGVNLQNASAVVHLDLPWTPARLEQRVGRVARMGSRHSRVHVYALTPPASSEALLGIERHLRAKLAAAGRSVGIAGSIVPVFATAEGGGGRAATEASQSGRRIGPPEQLAHARTVVGRWLDGSARMPVPAPNGAVYAAVESPTDGFLAACTDGGQGPRRLVASFGGRVSDAPADIAAAVRIAEGEPVPHDDARCEAALRALHDWWANRRAANDAGLAGVSGARARLRVLARIAAITHRAPRHVRPRLAALAAGARTAALTRCGIGAETVLGQLAEAAMPDGAWLRAVGAFGEAYAAGRFGASELGATLTVAGLIVFVPGRP